MITDEKRREIVGNLRYCAEMCYNAGVGVLGSDVLNALGIHCGDTDGMSDAYDVEKLADLIDCPTCLDLVEHKQDPFIPGKRMVDGYFHCSDCGWDGQIWEHIGFGDMLAYEAVHCPKCGAIIERRA